MAALPVWIPAAAAIATIVLATAEALPEIVAPFLQAGSTGKGSSAGRRHALVAAAGAPPAQSSSSNAGSASSETYQSYESSQSYSDIRTKFFVFLRLYFDGFSVIITDFPHFSLVFLKSCPQFFANFAQHFPEFLLTSYWIYTKMLMVVRIHEKSLKFLFGGSTNES